MKTLKQLNEEMLKNIQCSLELEKYNLWDTTVKINWELIYSGSMNECERKLSEYNFDSSFEIHKNEIKDIWEGQGGINYVTFENNITKLF